MSDGSISQDEIDALLAGADTGSFMGGMEPQGTQLSDFQRNTLAGFFEKTVLELSSNLQTATSKSVTVERPTIAVMNREGIIQKISDMVVAAGVNFNAGLSGEHIFVLSEEFAKKVVSLVNNEDNADLDDMGLSIISETFGQYAASELTAMEGAGFPGVGSVPPSASHSPKAMLALPQQDFVAVSYQVILDSMPFVLWEVIAFEAVTELVNRIGQGGSVQNNTMGGMNMGGGMMGDSMGGMNMGNIMSGGNPNVQSVQFPPLQGVGTSVEQGNIGLIMDVYMEITVELGRTKKMIKEILGMGEGHIIALDKAAGEPVDILVNHKPIAKGEVVVIEESFGVRVTEILSPEERIVDM